MRLINFVPLSLVMLIACGCTSTTKVRHHSDYKAVIERAKTVMILPPMAEVNTISVSGKKERMYDYETHLESVIAEIVVSAIEVKGFRIRLLRKRDIHEAHLTHIIASLRSNYNLAREQLYSPIEWEEKKAFSVEKNAGNAVIDLSKKVDSDLLVIIDYVGAVKTTGARTLDFATSIILGSSAGKDADNSSMIIGILDAKNGNILWSNMGVISKNIYNCAFDNFSSQTKVERETVNNLITQTLSPLNK